MAFPRRAAETTMRSIMARSHQLVSEPLRSSAASSSKLLIQHPQPDPHSFYPSQSDPWSFYSQVDYHRHQPHHQQKQIDHHQQFPDRQIHQHHQPIHLHRHRYVDYYRHSQGDQWQQHSGHLIHQECHQYYRQQPNSDPMQEINQRQVSSHQASSHFRIPYKKEEAIRSGDESLSFEKKMERIDAQLKCLPQLMERMKILPKIMEDLRSVTLEIAQMKAEIMGSPIASPIQHQHIPQSSPGTIPTMSENILLRITPKNLNEDESEPKIDSRPWGLVTQLKLMEFMKVQEDTKVLKGRDINAGDSMTNPPLPKTLKQGNHEFINCSLCSQHMILVFRSRPPPNPPPKTPSQSPPISLPEPQEIHQRYFDKQVVASLTESSERRKWQLQKRSVVEGERIDEETRGWAASHKGRKFKKSQSFGEIGRRGHKRGGDDVPVILTHMKRLQRWKSSSINDCEPMDVTSPLQDRAMEVASPLSEEKAPPLKEKEPPANSVMGKNLGLRSRDAIDFGRRCIIDGDRSASPPNFTKLSQDRGEAEETK